MEFTVIKEEQKEPSTSTSQGGGGREDDDEVGTDDSQQLPPTETIVDDDEYQRNKMEVTRLHQDVVLSNDLITTDRVRHHLDFSDLASTQSTSPERGSVGGGEVSGQYTPRPAAIPPFPDDDEGRRMKMAYLAQAVFSNSLITSSIWSNLNFVDLKVTRQVSRDFFDKITSFGGFKNSAVLQVTKESLYEAPHLFDKNLSMTQTWLGVQIEVDLPLEVLDKIRHILEHVEFISLFISRQNIEDVGFRQITFAKFIAGVLSSTPKLTSLQMDIRFLRNDLTSEVWLSAVIRDHLRNLESLELLRFPLESHKTKAYSMTNDTHYRGGREPAFLVSTQTAKNFQHLATLTAPSRLKRLRLSKYDVICTVNPEAAVRSFSSSFLDLLRRHRESLLEVTININVWKSCDDIRTLILPQLKTLTAVVDTAGTANFETFLMNHPALEELDIQVNNGTAGSRDLWEKIKRHCCASGEALKKLHLKMPEFFLGGFGAKDNEWAFLAGMKVLEDFQLQVSVGSFGSGTRLLETLPRNRKLQRLSLDKMLFERNFWNFRSQCIERGLEMVSTDAPLATKLELLRKFPNLKRLSFRHCPNAVDDDVIQLIFEEMTSLEELELSHCPYLTDVGIAGTGPQEEQARLSVQSLKGLRMLSIRACPYVTPKGLLSVLALPFLQHFDYYTSSPVPKSFVWGIAAQNPSLETISVHTATGDSDNYSGPNKENSVDIDNWTAWSAEEKKAFFAKHPRMKALVNLEKLKCDREYAGYME